MPEHISDDPPSRIVAGEDTANLADKPVVLKAMERLEGAINLLSARMATVDSFASETRQIARRTRWLAAVTALGGTVALVAGGFALDSRVTADDAQQRSDRNLEYQIANCVAGNQFRAEQLKMWLNQAAAVRALAPKSPGIQAFADRQVADANKNLAARDCSQVAEGRVH